MNPDHLDFFHPRWDAICGPLPVYSEEEIQEHQAQRDWWETVKARNAAFKKVHGRELRARTAARKAGLPLPELTAAPVHVASPFSIKQLNAPAVPVIPRAPRKPRPAPDPEAAFRKDLTRSCAIWGLDPDKALEWLEANRAVALGRAREYHVLKFRRPVADLLGQYKREKNAI